jgi:hypothetical protein
MVLKYEDLVTRTDETLDSLFAYLGVESDPATVNLVLDRTEASSDQSIMRGHQTSGGPAESIGRWRRDLEPDLQKVCEEEFGAALREFGYA